ncbi:MAG: ATP-binding cassette domain-containing protein, partial [Oscillospiraceae bacterium]
LSLELGEGIAGTVVKEGKSTVVKDCQKDKRWAGRFDEVTGFVTKSMICVPLVNKYEVIGCIQIINKKDGSLYNDDDISLCENLAMLTAIAVDGKGLDLGFSEDKKSIISLKNVTKTFGTGETQLQVLKGVNLDIREGEFLVILGESGCGKSTMLNIIGGMDQLTTGTFLFDGKDYSKADEKTLTEYRRHSVGFIFQAYNLMPTLTAEENLDFIGELCDNSMDAAEALERVGLSQRKDNYPAQMSGGQQQRVSIARALVKKPRIILADEPTAALDYETSIEVLTVLEEVIKSGTTLLMVTHNEEIAKMANRVIRMKGGVVAEVIVNRHPASAKELVW